MITWKTMIAALLAVSSLRATASVWPMAERSAFVSGCALGIIIPAKRDYAAAAERAGNANPKPFPEEQLRGSVEPMCSCLADRMAESGMSYLDVAATQDAVVPMIKEAMAGGRCQPGGLLGQAMSREAPKIQK